jgi:predicted YcjX-like family ATPase
MRVPDDAAGRSGTCKQCGSNVNVPNQGLSPAADPTQEQTGAQRGSRRLAMKGLGDAVLSAMPSGFMTRRRRIAITGLANTGKTVFLTTLLNHLNHHEPSEFRIFDETKEITVKQFTEEEPADKIEKFDYSIFAQAMRTGHWPRKTVDVSAYRCHFNTDNHWVSHQIEFLDWPGERVADVVMYKRDYAEWSDYLLKRWEVAEDNYRQHVKPYLTAAEQIGLTETSILNEYRLALARLILDYNPLISPSCFLVGRDGNRLRGSSAEQLAGAGLVGTSGDAQFAPLPKEIRQRQPERAATFAQRYEAYRRQVVCNLFDAVQRCNRLIVLVDIPSILASGHGRLNDNYDMIDELIKGLEATSSKATGFIKGIWHSLAPASWMWMGVEKIAFVATKADLVASDENRNNLRILMEQMLRDIQNRIPAVKIGYFVASPVKSTGQPQDGSFLTGKLMFDEGGSRLPPDAPEQTYKASAVPSKWPERWSSGQYHFPAVYPAIPKGKFMLPKHIGLDRVLQFVLE